MKLEDSLSKAKPLADYTEEELIALRDVLRGATHDLIKAKRSYDEFIYSCDNYAFREFGLSDFVTESRKPERKIATTKNADSENDALCVQIGKALMKWDPDRGRFTTFFHAFLNRLPKIPYQQKSALSQMSKKIYKELLRIIKALDPETDPSLIINREIFYGSELIIEAVKSAKPDIAEANIRETANDFVDEMQQSNEALPDDIVKLEDDEESGNEAIDIIAQDSAGQQEDVLLQVYDILESTFLKAKASGKFKKEILERISLILTSELCENDRTPSERKYEELSQQYSFISKDYHRLFRLMEENDHFPNRTELAAIFGVRKNTISNMMERFREFR